MAGRSRNIITTIVNITMIVALFTSHTGLTPSITIKDLNYSVAKTGTMTEIGGGFYKFDFLGVMGQIYIVEIDGGASILNVNQRYLSFSQLEDMKVKDVGSGLRMGSITNEVRPKWIKELLDEQKKEIIKELYEEPEEKFDLSPIIDKLEEVKKSIPRETIKDDKKEKESLKKIDKIEKFVDFEIKEKEKEIKEKLKEQEKEKKKEEKEQKLTEEILSKLDQCKKDDDSIMEVVKKMEEEEVNNILKLIK